MQSTLRDAELRLRFAEAYLLEVTDERDRAADPRDWDDRVLDAMARVKRAREAYQRMREDAGGVGLGAVG